MLPCWVLLVTIFFVLFLCELYALLRDAPYCSTVCECLILVYVFPEEKHDDDDETAQADTPGIGFVFVHESLCKRHFFWYLNLEAEHLVQICNNINGVPYKVWLFYTDVFAVPFGFDQDLTEELAEDDNPGGIFWGIKLCTSSPYSLEINSSNTLLKKIYCTRVQPSLQM